MKLSTATSSSAIGMIGASAYPTRSSLASTTPSKLLFLAATMIFSNDGIVSASQSVSQPAANAQKTSGFSVRKAPSFLSTLRDLEGSDDLCVDNLTFSFSFGVGNRATCNDIDLTNAGAVRADRWCDPGNADNVIEQCRASCGLCGCVDNPNYRFQDAGAGGAQVGCAFLSDNGAAVTQGERALRQQRFCDATLDAYVGEFCPASCGVCSNVPSSSYCANNLQALPPIPLERRDGEFIRPVFQRRTQYRSNRFDACYIEYLETDTGYVVINNPGHPSHDNFAEVNDETGEFVDTGILARNIAAGGADPTTSLILFGARKSQLIRTNVVEIAKNILETNELEHPSRSRLLASKDTQNHRQSQATTGLIKNLVIPFRFANQGAAALPVVTPRDDLDTLFNGPNPSVNGFFDENSFGNLNIQSSVVNWITLDDNQLSQEFCSGVVQNDPHRNDRTQMFRCLKNALDQVQILFDDNNFGPGGHGLPSDTNFGDFDTNNDGMIDSITFLHSGFDPTFLSSHKWEMDDEWIGSASNNAEVRVGPYSITASPALGAGTIPIPPTLGALTYGIAAVLGAEDLSDVDGDGSGIGIYDLMADPWGVANGLAVPPLMSAYTKMKFGWINPTIIAGADPKRVVNQLRAACDFPDALKITANYPDGEYLLIENRQPCGSDLPLNQLPNQPAGGIAIYHVDEERTGIDASIQDFPQAEGAWPGNGKHYRVSLLQADGRYELERDLLDALGNDGDTTDLFRAGGVNSIGPDGTSNGASFPNTDIYRNGNIRDSGVTISEIGESDDTIRVVVSVAPSSSNSRPSAPSPSNSRPSAPSPSNSRPRNPSKGKGKGKQSPPLAPPKSASEVENEDKSKAEVSGVSTGASASASVAASSGIAMVVSLVVVGLVLATIGVAYFIGRRNGRFMKKRNTPEYSETETKDYVLPVQAFPLPNVESNSTGDDVEMVHLKN